MTQQDDDALLSAEEKEDDKEGKEGKGKGKAESGALGRGEVAVEAGFFEHMAKIGASAGQISEILKSWRQLRGAGLARALVDFARSVARASAHTQVEIAPNKDFGLIHNFIQHVKALVR
ncbi:MAG TPA: hypothetical protein DCY07_02475, partial [Rhodospirillaceae bacterium]|nr:hypothetical protein [Rhodospirillaceae bacterium]